jgi:hypothetical protein
MDLKDKTEAIEASGPFCEIKSRKRCRKCKRRASQIRPSWEERLHQKRSRFWFFARHAVANSRAKAKRLEIPHTLTAYDIDKLLVDQGYLCAVTGIELAAPINRATQPFGPSLDRIVPAIGYVVGNVRVTCLIVNLAMNRWGEGALRKLLLEGQIKTTSLRGD